MFGAGRRRRAEKRPEALADFGEAPPEFTGRHTMDTRSPRLHFLPGALVAAVLACTAAPDPAAAQAPEGTYHQIHSFVPPEGVKPRGTPLVLPDGGIVGTASESDSPDHVGTLYLLKPGSHSLKVLHAFGDGSNDGLYPVAGVIADRQGDLWGTTYGGGEYGRGTIFRISGMHYAVVHMFGQDPGDGSYPATALTLGNDGLLYGTTLEGGSSDRGTVFRLNADGSATTLWDFAPGGPRNPNGRLLQASDGLLYGTTTVNFDDGEDLGTIYALAPDGSQQRIVHRFSEADGWDSLSGVIEGSDGRLYGTTWLGGANETGGVVYRVDRDGSDYVVLHSFQGGSEGKVSRSELVETRPGVFFGMTELGGKAGRGTVFRMLASGELTVIHSFTGQPRHGGAPDGIEPAGALVPVGDDMLIGVTEFGGVYQGTIFKLRAR